MEPIPAVEPILAVDPDLPIPIPILCEVIPIPIPIPVKNGIITSLVATGDGEWRLTMSALSGKSAEVKII